MWSIIVALFKSTPDAFVAIAKFWIIIADWIEARALIKKVRAENQQRRNEEHANLPGKIDEGVGEVKKGRDEVSEILKPKGDNTPTTSPVLPKKEEAKPIPQPAKKPDNIPTKPVPKVEEKLKNEVKEGRDSLSEILKR